MQRNHCFASTPQNLPSLSPCSIHETLDLEFSVANAGSLVPMKCRCPYPTIRQPNIGNTFAASANALRLQSFRRRGSSRIDLPVAKVSISVMLPRISKNTLADFSKDQECRRHRPGLCSHSAQRWRKLVGVEPTRDTKCRTTGFEDQAQHRPRLASSRDSIIPSVNANRFVRAPPVVPAPRPRPTAWRPSAHRSRKRISRRSAPS